MLERTMVMHNNDYLTVSLDELSPVARLVIKLFFKGKYTSALRLLEKKIKHEENFNAVNILKLMSALIQIMLRDYETAIVLLEEITDIIEPERAKEICHRALQICSNKMLNKE